MEQYILLALIFFLPFLVHQFGISAYETPKVMVAEGLIGILAIFKVFKIKTLSFTELNNQSYYLLLGLFLLSLVHLVTSPSQAFFGNVFRLQGVFLLWTLITFALASGSITLKSSFKWVYTCALVVIFTSIFFYNYNQAGRAVGVLGEPNALAATSLIFLTYIWFYQKKWVGVVALLLTLIIFYLTRSRSAMIAIGIEAILIFLTGIKLNLKVAVVASVTLTVLSLFSPFVDSLSSLGSTVKPLVPGFEDRADIWMASAYAGLKSPLFGVGFGNIQNAIHESAIELDLRIQYAVVDSAHNLILDYWVAGGITGVLLILGLIWTSINTFIKEKQNFELTLLLGVLTVMLFNPVTIIVLLVFWWLLGRGIYLSSRGERT